MRRNREHGDRHQATNRRLALPLLLLLTVGMVSWMCGPADAAGTANESICPNEGLRLGLGWTRLPDCRGYEMVSPPYKEGYPVLVSGLAPDGNSAVVESLGAMAGVAGSSENVATGEVYTASRTPSGWQFSPVNAPLSEFVGQRMVAAEAARGETLWMQHAPEDGPHENGFYVRLPNGVFHYIGPASPPPGSKEPPSNVAAFEAFEIDQPKGATDDYSHLVVLAEYEGTAWPFDKTPVTESRVTSLYEYSGLDNQAPTLVGVIGPRGSANLIALCGTVLGSGTFGSSFNALSRDGEAIFFTVNPCSPGPEYAELYARLRGAVNGIGAAETVHVSASECAPTCEGESGKNFEGASEDGRLVFFTSTQKLNDEAVDGVASGNSASGQGCATTAAGKGGCNLYLYNFQPEGAPHLTTVSVGGEVLGVVGIAEDGSRVYYVSRAAIGSAGTNTTGSAPVQGMPNLYVYDAIDHKTSYVVSLGNENEDRSDWSRTFGRPAQVTGEAGRDLLFASSTPGITPDDTSSITQLFEYRAEEGNEPAELVRVTKGEDEYNGDGNDVATGVEPTAIVASPLLGRGSDFKTSTNRLNVSEDGKRVFFKTAGQLSPRATSAASGCESLYEFHTSGRLSEGTVRLVSDGQDTQLYRGAVCGVLFQGIDATGANVLFSTGDPLVGTDVDGLERDTYDARVEGGFEPPFEAGACGLGSCEGAVSAPPAPPVAGQAAPTAPPSTSASASALAGSRSHTSKRAAGNKRLRRALRACRGRPRARRVACERAARRQSGTTAKTTRIRGAGR